MSSGYGVFLSEFWNNFHTPGAIAPSSRWLADALTKHVPSSKEAAPRRILEVGPGTGAVTAALVRRLAPQDSLTLVELNDRFVEHLRGRFAREPEFQAVHARAEIVHDRLENLPVNQPFDVIVSGLPLNNFSVDAVQQILATLERLLPVGGRLSFFEYIAVRAARGAVSLGAERRRITGITRALRATFARHDHGRDWIWPNLPPAWVHHLCKVAG
ncbi:MAG: methyltransferase domain-containing protein [Planctomycetaceae bacterium]|nr:methyltransferase domain-containing protein [Planctomycetaceae bacterium]